MPQPVIESTLFRVNSKGTKFAARLDGTAPPSPMTMAYLQGFNFVSGVKTIKGPKMGRNKIDMTELNNGQLSTALFSELPTDPLGSTSTVVTQEMYFYKVRAPGTKVYGPVELALNMTSFGYDTLMRWFERSRMFPWVTLIRTAVTPAQAATPPIPDPPPSFMFGYGYVKSLGPKTVKGELVTADVSIQPSHGVGFLSVCTDISTLVRVWKNFIPYSGC